MVEKKNKAAPSLYLGLNEIGQRSNLENISRSMHSQIVGATGTGKTESAMLPMIASDIEAGYSVLFIDPKGDKDTFEILRELCLFYGRSSDLVLLDLCKPNESCKYNPLKIGSSSELKDKIVGSIIWSEEFYKKVAERALLESFQFLDKVAQPATIGTIYKILSGSPFDKVIENNKNEMLKLDYDDLKNRFTRVRDQLEGVKTDLALWNHGDFAEIIQNADGDSVLDWFTQKKIVYINLNTLAFEETSRRFGRLVVQDIKAAVQRIQGMAKAHRQPIRVYIDEFSAVASSGFIELLNKARSANVAITLAHQSLGDIQNVSDAFVNQILDNTNVKIMFRLDSPDSCEFFGRLIGTRKCDKETMQTQSGIFGGVSQTGVGSTRSTEEFIVSPNEFKKLSRGEGYVLTKIPYSVSRIQFKSISQRLTDMRNVEQKRRIKWPSFIKGA